MKETLEIRVNKKYASLLFDPNEGIDKGSVIVIRIDKNDPRYDKIGELRREINDKFEESFFFGWEFIRKYSKEEIENARLFSLYGKYVEESGEQQLGTVYDYTDQCQICKSDSMQIDHLILPNARKLKKDINVCFGGEVIVNEKFYDLCINNNLLGAEFLSVNFEKKVDDKFYQLKPIAQVDFSDRTLTGVGPYDFSEESEGVDIFEGGKMRRIEKEIYKCPSGHTLGLNLLSEVFVRKESIGKEYDFYCTRQKIGVHRGELRPRPVLLCSNRFMKLAKKENITGAHFEVAYIG